MKNVMDIIERFQTHHALQEEREMANSNVTGNGAAAPSVPGKNTIFETEEVRVGTVAVPGNTEWSPPHDGRDRLVVPWARWARHYQATAINPFPLEGLGSRQTAISQCPIRQIRQEPC
jgi:hypothetical protein